MAQSIALNIKVKIDGNEQVITNLEQTENAIKQLKQELSTTEFGSKRFQEISVDLQKLRAQVENVDKATEGLGMEKRLRAINDATNLLTGSFSLLTGAMTLAAASEEDLVKIQQAEAKAMAAVNIVLGARAISEGLLESRVLRREAAEKLSIATSRIFITTAKLVSSGLKSIGISAGVASQGVRVLTSALFALGIPAIIYGLTLLYEKLTETNDELENKAPLTAKEYYDELKTSIDKLNETQTLRLNYAKAFGASEKEILEQDLKDKQAIYDKTNEAQKDLFNKLAFLNGELLKNQGAFSGRARKNLQADIAVVRENISKITNDLTKFSTDRKNAELAITDFEKKEQEKRQQQAKEAAEKRKQTEIKNIQERLAAQLKYIETLKALGSAEVEVDAEVIEKVKAIIADQDALLERRIENAKTAKEKLQEELELDLFKIIPSPEEKKLFQDSFATLFRGLSFGFDEAEKELIDGTNATFEELLEIGFKYIPKLMQQQAELNQIGTFAIIDPNNAVPPLLKQYKTNLDTIKKFREELETNLDGTPEEIAERTIVLNKKIKLLELQNKSLFTDEGKKAIVDYFNLLNRYSTQFEKGITLGNVKLKIPTDKAQVVIETLINEAQTLLSTEEILPGDIDKQLSDKIVEVFAKDLGQEFQSLAGLNDVAKEKAIAYNTSLKALMDTFKELALDAGGTKVEIRKVGDELNDLSFISTQKEQELIESTKITDQVFKNSAEKIKATATESSEGFTSFVDDLIANTREVKEVLNEQGDIVEVFGEGIRDKYIKAFSPEGLIKLLKEGATGLKDITFENEQEITDLVNKLKQLELELGDSITTTIELADGTTEKVGSGYATFADIIDALIKKQQELQKETKETGETFADTFSESKFNKIAEAVFNIFSETSSRLSELYTTSNSLLLEKLQYANDTTLALIGEANTESVAQNKKITEERLKIEKDYQKKKFEIEKRARIQELQFTLANAIASSAQAIVGALKTPPLGVGIALSAIIGLLTAAQVAVIRDQIQFTQSKTFIGRRGGLIQGNTHEEGGVPALLEGGEFVMSRAAVEQYGDTLGMMNASVGSRPLAIDDSRIVQAIAKQNTGSKTPLKTYVLYNDIQNTEKLNNKIEQLSRL